MIRVLVAKKINSKGFILTLLMLGSKGERQMH